jgi:hypothetical protein
MNALRALDDRSTNFFGEVLHGCTQTRVRLPASPRPPARIVLLWPGEHPSLVSLYIISLCFTALQSCELRTLCTTLFGYLSNVSFSRPIISHILAFAKQPSLCLRVAPILFLSVRKLLRILYQAAYFLRFLFAMSFPFIHMLLLFIVLSS